MPDLTDLPTELVELVGQQCGLAEIRALRSTCRILCNALDHTFKRRFFKSQSVHLLKSSIDELLHMTDSRFVKYVEFVIIDFDEDYVIDVITDLDRWDINKTHFLRVGEQVTVTKTSPDYPSYRLGDTITLSSQSVSMYNACLLEKQEEIGTKANVHQYENIVIYLAKVLKNLPSLKGIKLSMADRKYFSEELYAYAFNLDDLEDWAFFRTFGWLPKGCTGPNDFGPFGEFDSHCLHPCCTIRKMVANGQFPIDKDNLTMIY